MGYFKTPVILFVFFAVSTARVSGQEEECTTPKGEAGMCMQLAKCKRLFQMSQDIYITPDERRFLSQSRCNLNETEVWICCPPAQPQLIRLCTTPNGHNGACLPLDNCPRLRELAEDWTKERLNQSFCYDVEGDGGSRYCCRIETLQKKRNNENINVGSLLALDHQCGRSSPERAGEGTVWYRHPWLALLVYKADTAEQDYMCGGVLIGKRFVLTAAHCIFLRKMSLISVRLGERITDQQKDCGGSESCSSSTYIKVEAIIPHPHYRATSTRKDIAIIRLASDAPDFTRSICLPDYPISVGNPVGGPPSDVFVAGWGVFDSRASDSTRHAALQLASKSDCQTYSNVKSLTNEQFCAGSAEDEDTTCFGDSGGPLMRSERGQWFLHGLEALACRGKGIPGVYTKVYNYKKWIRNNL